MSETIFWIWNGWGILLTFGMIIWIILHIAVTAKLGSGTPLRGILALIPIIILPLIIMLCGWMAALLAIPIGVIIGASLARMFFPPVS